MGRELQFIAQCIDQLGLKPRMDSGLMRQLAIVIDNRM